MESFLIYLIKASALLGIFYSGYLFLLKKETSFQLNRRYLLLGLITAGILPAIYFTKKVYIEASLDSFNFIAASSEASQIPIETTTDWWQVAGIIYLIVTGFFLLRLAIQLSAVMKIIANNSIQKNSGLNYLKVSENQLPFSFFNYIVFNPEKHSGKDLELILEHEKIHARQYHSADILLVNLASCLLWFNPFAWLYKKAVEQNLEFIADRETVSNKAEIKEYQHALVKVSIADLKPALTNHFYQSFIKKRIIMLNKKSSKQSPAWKLSLVMPLLLAFMLVFNVKTEAQVVTTTKKETRKENSLKSGISVRISEKSSKESLDKLSSYFKKQGVNLLFENLKYSEEGLLINVEATFEDTETGNKGRLVRNNTTGIEAFHFYKNDNGEIGFKDDLKQKKSIIGGSFTADHLSKLGDMPLYVIAGKTYPAKSVQNKHISIKSGLEVLSPEEATEKYGAPGKDGALIIPDGKLIGDFKSLLKSIDASNENFKGDFVMIDKSGKPFLMNIDSRITSSPDANKNLSEKHRAAKSESNPTWKIDEIGVAVSSVTFSTSEKDQIKNELDSLVNQKEDIPAVNTKNSTMQVSSQNEKPLYVLNGVVKSSSYKPKDLNSDNIATINVIKGAAGLKKYGKKAKNGVIEIYTEDFEGDTSAPIESDLRHINAKYTINALENIKAEILEKIGLKIEFSKIKRNADGLITEIKISGQSESGQKASATYKNKEGIPDILIGLDNKDRLVISSNKI